MIKIFISAGDASGDLHASKLMMQLRALIPDIEFIGIGGREMEKQGLKSIIPLNQISVVGFWEVAKKYNLFKSLIDKCKSIISSGEISAFIPVDYPGFNIRIAGYAKSINIPVIYYIAPQLWAWGKNRAKKLAASVDKLLVVFPFEEEYFAKFGIDTQFVGHPLLDIDEFSHNFLKYEERDNSIIMLAGSREQEIHKHLPLLIRTSEIIHKSLPDYKLIFAKSKSVSDYTFNSVEKTHPYIEISSDTRNLMLKAKAGIIKTGTSNLEAALSGLPFSMYYITSFISYNMGKKLINLEYLSIVNILKDKSIIKEFIQKEAIPELIAKNTINIINNKDTYSELQNTFYEIRSNLGGSGASANAAKVIADYLK